MNREHLSPTGLMMLKALEGGCRLDPEELLKAHILLLAAELWRQIAQEWERILNGA
jgi:hypothetical protein